MPGAVLDVLGAMLDVPGAVEEWCESVFINGFDIRLTAVVFPEIVDKVLRVTAI